MRKSLRVVQAAVVVIAVTGSAVSASTVPANEDVTFAGLFVSGDRPVIPEGTSGELVVAMQGPGTGAIAPVVVRNNTDAIVYDVVVEGIARNAAGTLVATGQSQQMLPYAVVAGGIAFSYVYFEAGDLTGTETFEYQVSASETDTAGLSTLPISEATIVERDVVGLVNNPGADPVPGALVGLACFNDADQLTWAYWGSTDGDEIAPGGLGRVHPAVGRGLFERRGCRLGLITAWWPRAPNARTGAPSAPPRTLPDTSLVLLLLQAEEHP